MSLKERCKGLDFTTYYLWKRKILISLIKLIAPPADAGGGADAAADGVMGYLPVFLRAYPAGRLYAGSAGAKAAFPLDGRPLIRLRFTQNPNSGTKKCVTKTRAFSI